MAIEEPFAQGRSFLHRLDPRAKLVAAAVYACVAAVLRDVRVLGLGVGFSAALLLAARLDGRRLARRVLVVNAFVAFVWLFVPWSVDGETVVQIGALRVTHEGLLLALRLTLRCNAIVLALIALLGTSRVTDLARALRLLRTPEKLVLVLFFCVRYVQVIREEYRRLIEAAKVRGFRPAVRLHTYRTYANLIGVLLVRSHDRAARVYEAMLCRGFKGRFPTLKEPRLRGVDVTAGAIIVVFTAALVLLEWMAITH
jgi:cobalt/nickel transport system permease protein